MQIIVRPFDPFGGHLLTDRYPVTSEQGIAFNLIIIRIDQGRAVQTTLVSQATKRRSMRFPFSGESTTQCMSTTTQVEDKTNNIGPDTGIAMKAFEETESSLPGEPGEGFAASPV